MDGLFLRQFVLLTALYLIRSSQASSCSCNRKWELVATTDSTGNVTQGCKTKLIEAVYAGAEIRIQLPSSGYLTSVQNAHLINDNVCVQALFHISKDSYDSFQSKAYWWFVSVCSSGSVDIKRYYVGKHDSAGISKKNWAVKWFVRELSNTPLKHTSGNTVVLGDVSSLVSDVEAGSDVRIVSECGGYNAPMDSVEISKDDGKVVGQSLYHISQKESSGNYVFQGKDYWWFTNWVSKSNAYLKMTRWNVGEHTNRGDSNIKQQITWHTDTCWQLAYKHDAEGKVEEGSLNILRSAVLSGHRIKLLYGDTISVEPDEVSVRGGHVNAVILRMVKKHPSDSTMFDLGAKWDWRILTTTGKETTLSVNVGEYVEKGRTNGKRAISWFIDNRQWTKVLVNDDSGSVLSGSKPSLIAAVNEGARVRYTLRFKKSDSVTVHEADNLAFNDQVTEVAAEHVRSVSLQRPKGSKTEVEFQSKPYFWFTISSTTGKVDMSRWTVGKYESRGHTNNKAQIEWFVNL